MSRRISRRLRSLLLLLTGALLLAACGSTAAVTPTAAPSAPEPTAAAAEPTAAAPEPTAAAPEPTAAAPSEPAVTDGNVLEFGVVGHLYYTDRDRVMQLTQNAGFDWFRQQIYWRDIEDPDNGIWGWDELDRIVDAVNRYDRKLLVNVVRSPSAYNETNGLPDDPATLANFFSELVKRYGDKIDAFEVWNEPNLAHETGGTIRPEDVGHYVEILKASYNAIKALNPDAIVLAAASSSSGVTNPSVALSDEEFYRLMYTYNGGEARNYMDVQAVHPGGAANPPDKLYPEDPSFIEGCQPAPDQCWNDHPTHYFRHIENVYGWMQQYGLGDKPVWITEFGWAIPNNTPGYEFGNYVSPEQQAEYVSAALTRVHENYPFVTNMFLWNINFAVLWGEQGNPDHEQAAFGILNPDWSPRASFLAAQGTIAQIKQKQGRFVAP
jgi:hypothetical protein